MPLETVSDLLNFDGSLPEALHVQSRAGVLNEIAGILAHARAQTLLELVRAEIEPARNAAAAAAAEAAAAEAAWRRLMAICERVSQEGDREKRLAAQATRDNAKRVASELLVVRQKADQRSQQLIWLETSLQTIERPELDALKILFSEVNSG